jgi:GNAT superfamily N-acetyltransferase
VLAAASGEGLVGLAVVIVGQDRAELKSLFVDPRHWRKGVGSALVDAATHEARRAGLSLTVIAEPQAREFYERCGFAVEGEAETRFGPALRMSR